MTYSTAVYALTVAITLNEDTNTLVASMMLNENVVTEAVAAFENTYDYTPGYPENPQTGDNSALALWAALTFVSGGAALTLCAYDRKRRRQERE